MFCNYSEHTLRLVVHCHDYAMQALMSKVWSREVEMPAQNNPNFHTLSCLKCHMMVPQALFLLPSEQHCGASVAKILLT